MRHNLGSSDWHQLVFKHLISVFHRAFGEQCAHLVWPIKSDCRNWSIDVDDGRTFGSRGHVGRSVGRSGRDGLKQEAGTLQVNVR